MQPADWELLRGRDRSGGGGGPGVLLQGSMVLGRQRLLLESRLRFVRQPWNHLLRESKGNHQPLRTRESMQPADWELLRGRDRSGGGGGPGVLLQGSVCCSNDAYGLCGSPGTTCCESPGGTINLCAPGSHCNQQTGNCYVGETDPEEDQGFYCKAAWCP